MFNPGRTKWSMLGLLCVVVVMVMSFKGLKNSNPRYDHFGRTLTTTRVFRSEDEKQRTTIKGAEASWAVVVPTITREIAVMHSMLQRWDDTPPCDLEHPTAPNTDLIFFYHLDTNADLDKHAQSLHEGAKYRSCFRDIYVIAGHLRPEEDVYPVGSNAMFYLLLLSQSQLFSRPYDPTHLDGSKTDSNVHNNYKFLLYVEHDSIPIKSGWIGQLQAEAAAKLPFLILGAVPQPWIKTLTLVEKPDCKSCYTHLNGNGVYHMEPRLLNLVARTMLDQRVRKTGSRDGYDQALFTYLFECEAREDCAQYYAQTYPLLVPTNTILNLWRMDWCLNDIRRTAAVFVHGGFNEGLTTEKRVIAISLWGNRTEYNERLLENLRDGWRRVFPCWTVRVYTTRQRNTDPALPDQLKKAGAEVVVVEDEPGLQSLSNAMMWRFAVASDPDVDRYLIRDADTVVLQRDKDAVDDWVRSGLPFHSMMDHNAHCYNKEVSIMGGMWGGTREAVPEMSQLMKKWDGQKKYNDDQLFLKEHVYPLAKTRGVKEHNSGCCEEKRWEGNAIGFPTRRERNEYVGCYAGSSGKDCLHFNSHLMSKDKRCSDRNEKPNMSFAETDRITAVKIETKLRDKRKLALQIFLFVLVVVALSLLLLRRKGISLRALMMDCVKDCDPKRIDSRVRNGLCSVTRVCKKGGKLQV